MHASPLPAPADYHSRQIDADDTPVPSNVAHDEMLSPRQARHRVEQRLPGRNVSSRWRCLVPVPAPTTSRDDALARSA